MNLFSPARPGQPAKRETAKWNWPGTLDFYLNRSWENIFRPAMMQIGKKEWREGPSWVSFIWPFSELFSLFWSRERMKLGIFLMHQCLTMDSLHSKHHLFAGIFGSESNWGSQEKIFRMTTNFDGRWRQLTDKHISRAHGRNLHSKRPGRSSMYFQGDLWIKCLKLDQVLCASRF